MQTFGNVQSFGRWSLQVPQLSNCGEAYSMYWFWCVVNLDKAQPRLCHAIVWGAYLNKPDDKECW